MNKDCIWILLIAICRLHTPVVVYFPTERVPLSPSVHLEKWWWTIQNWLICYLIQKPFFPQRVTAAPLTENLWCPTDICFIGPTTTITTTGNVHANVYICCAGCFNDALPSLSGNRNPGLQFVNVQILFQCKATEPEAATHKHYLASILLGKPTYWEEN